MEQKEEIIEEITDICKDYKLVNFTKEHVEEWIKQFDKEDEIFILSHLRNILKKCYISEKEIDNWIDIIVNQIRIKKLNITYGILEINKHGDSQRDLNKKLIDKLRKNGIRAEIADVNDYNENRFQHYIYIDDVLYTGNTLLNDLRQLEKNKNKIDIFFYIVYNQGKNYVNKEIEEKGLKGLKGKYIIKYANESFSNINYSILDKNHIFPIKSDFLFSINDGSRERFEDIFYKYGEDQLSTVKQAASSLKPFGYSKIGKHGFGNMIVLYRNISNNSPLALWYGNIDEYKNKCWSNGPLGQFYPLFPRKVN